MLNGLLEAMGEEALRGDETVEYIQLGGEETRVAVLGDAGPGYTLAAFGMSLERALPLPTELFAQLLVAYMDAISLLYDNREEWTKYTSALESYKAHGTRG